MLPLRRHCSAAVAVRASNNKFLRRPTSSPENTKARAGLRGLALKGLSIWDVDAP
jgi:hypothetical protein